MAIGNQGDGTTQSLSDMDTQVLDFRAVPAPDDVQLLSGFSAPLEAVRRDGGRSVAQQIEMTEVADRGARDLLQHMEAAYVTSGRDAEAPEQLRVWEAAAAHAAQLAAAYLHLVKQFQTYSQGWAEVGDRLPLVVARALRATAMQLKWQLLRYRPVDPAVWENLSRLWSFVEDKGLSGARVLVYDDESTPRREFLKPLMLAMSVPGSLSPVELSVAERITAHLAGRFDLQRFPAKGCHFFVDIDQWSEPRRFGASVPVHLGFRFFGPGTAVTELDHISSALASGEMAAGEVNLKGVTDMELVVRVLAHLGRHWWLRRQERSEERRQASSEIGVIHGFDAIVATLGVDGVPLEGMASAIETWGIENESEGGYGAVLPIDQGHGLRVGEVLGVRPANSRLWAVGIVRRLTTQDGARRYVGIQLLARGVRAVSLQGGEGQKPQTALLLPSHADDSVNQGEISLLLPAGGFSSESNLQMALFNASYLLEPRMLLENGEDFEMARFRVVHRAG